MQPIECNYISQVSILQPLILNVFLYNLFFWMGKTVIGSYVVDSIPCIVNETKKLFFNGLEKLPRDLFKWFDDNYARIKISKRHLLVFGIEKIGIILRMTLSHLK